MSRGPSTKLRWFALALVCMASACGDSTPATPPAPPPPSEAAPAPRPKPDLRVAILTDPKGYLEPCGCTSRPLGGIDHLAATIQDIKEEGIPLALVAAGPLFFDGVDRGPEAAVADRWRAETLVEIWNGLGMSAAAPSPADQAQGLETFEALRAAAAFPLLRETPEPPPSAPAEEPSPEAQATGAAPPAPVVTEPSDHTLVTLGTTKVGFVSVQQLTAGPEGADPLARAATAVDALRKEGAAVVFALALGDRAFHNRVADVPGVSFVVRGGLDLAEPLPPSRRGEAYLLHAGHQGRHLVVVDLYLRGDRPYVDASAWTREAAQATRAEEAEDLAARIAAWEREAAVNPSDLTAQRERLAQMRRELAAPPPPVPSEGNAFFAQLLEIAPSGPSDEEVSATLRRFDRRVNEHNRVALADVEPPPALPGEPHYVGSAKCRSCHTEAFRWWRGHAHGRAYQTLVSVDKQFHLDCVGCHVTGYNQRGGSNATHNLDGALVNVGCESCHGPGSAHVANPTEVPRTVVRSPSESTCTTCHNDEHSDVFDFEVYRQRLLAPGHGLGAGS